MNTLTRHDLQHYLSLEYPFTVLVDEDGGYVVVFPDLPGCMTQADSLAEIGFMAEDARRLWIESAYEDDQAIPLPSRPETYSGKFIVRAPKSLHRALAESAEAEGISLNQYVVSLLARRDSQARIERRLDSIAAAFDEHPAFPDSPKLNIALRP